MDINITLYLLYNAVKTTWASPENCRKPPEELGCYFLKRVEVNCVK